MPKVIGLEGGPCGGKSTALTYIAQQASERGVQIERITEIAGQKLGELSLQGITYGDIKGTPERLYEFQLNLLHSIVAAIEHKRATVPANTLIVADRVDNAAYIEPEMYQAICNDLGFAESPMHSLVDTILYFPTLAKHDPEQYERLVGGNPARHEASVADAIATCDANLATTRNHPDFWLLATPDFERRLRYAGNIALRDSCKQPLLSLGANV